MTIRLFLAKVVHGIFDNTILFELAESIELMAFNLVLNNTEGLKKRELSFEFFLLAEVCVSPRVSLDLFHMSA